MKFIIRTIIKYVKVLFVVGFILVEWLGWEKIGQPCYEMIKSWGIMDKFRVWVSTVTHRYLLLMIFLMMFGMMELMSSVGIILIGSGSVVLGSILYVGKLLFTIPVVITFNVAKDTLTSFWVIKYTYGMILNFKRSKTYRGVKHTLFDMKKRIATINVQVFGEQESVKWFRPMYNTLRKK